MKDITVKLTESQIDYLIDVMDHELYEEEYPDVRAFKLRLQTKLAKAKTV